ncbi:MAG: hypothetical protein GQ532_21125 [Methylomarinum sp.]|nr:hypothetical protein [Methylomarinum sp.]
MEVGPTGGGGHAHAAAQAKPATPAAELESKQTPVEKSAETQATPSISPNTGQNINIVA